MLDDIIVEYPHGAGGAFLSNVLACCILDQPLYYKPINFHGAAFKTQSNHLSDCATNVISIDDPAARFNFWMYYFRKRVAFELESYRFKGQKWIRCPYERTTSAHQDAYWLLNQCNFVITYHSKQIWRINWRAMVERPASVWSVVQDFLSANQQPNHWNLSTWVCAVEHYRKTLGKIIINENHVRWQIWSTALLLSQQIRPDFDIVDNFRSPVFLEWLKDHRSYVIEYTQQCHWPLGEKFIAAGPET